MKYLFLIVTGGIIFQNSLVAQEKVIPQPENKVIYVDGQWREKDTRNLRHWYVVSDRRDNQVYNDMQCTNPVAGFKPLDFGESVYVLDYKSGSLQVTRPQFVNASKVFIGNDNDRGWIKESNIVLSNFCQRTERNPLLPNVTNGLYTRKVFIFNSPGTYEKPAFYAHPTEENDSLGRFNISTSFYVYKTEGNKLLLGSKPEKNTMIDKNLIGWINMANTASWNHNMCLEKNWYEEAVSERRSEPFPARTMSSLEDAERGIRGEENFILPLRYNETDDEKYGFKNIRIDGDMFRSPIINTLKKDSLFEVGYLSRGAENIDSEEEDEFLKCLANVINQLNTINLVFLIDGTHSILPYKKTIVDNIQDALNSLQGMISNADNKSDIRLRYNAFIYRDDPYTRKFSFRRDWKMTSNSAEIINFINEELVDPGSVRDDLPESMYWGFKIIQERLTDIKPFEKTFVIVIGDAGDHQRNDSQTYLTTQEVIRLLLPKTYSVSAIQVRHISPDKISNPDPRNKNTYNEFRNQFKNILTDYYNQKYHVRIPSNSTEIIGDGITKFPNSSVKIPSMLIYPADNDTISPEALGEQLRNLIINAPMADFRLELPCNIPPGVLDYLRISPRDPDFKRKALYGMMNFYYVKGFIPDYVKNSNGNTNSYRLFNDVQYFKTDELNTIDEQLRILIPDNSGGSTGQSPRQRLFTAWQNILVNRMKMVDESEFPKITLQEAALFLTQNKGREEWANIRMADLNTEGVFTNEMLGNYYFDWFTTKIMVQSILNNESWFNNQNMVLHSDVFQFCYELLTGREWSSYVGPERERMRNELINRVMEHYRTLNFTDIQYIRNLARCAGKIRTFEVNEEGDLVSGGDFDVLWVSGEYFPHDNDFAIRIFNN